MDESSIRVAPEVRATERVVVHVDSKAARWIGGKKGVFEFREIVEDLQSRATAAG